MLDAFLLHDLFCIIIHCT